MGNLIKETPYSEITATLEALQALGVERRHFEAVRKDPTLASSVAQAIIAGYILADPIKAIFPTSVDYSKSLAQMIKSCNLNWVNPNITEAHFPKGKAGGKAEFNLEFFHPNKVMSSDQILIEMKNRKLRPAELPMGLAFAEKYPEEQRKGPIVIFGSMWRGWRAHRLVPYLYSISGRRYLRLYWFEDGWDVGYWFLAVREPA
ncbi:MAG: hypothetical protein A3I24_03945 [Candidatus Harrisonbacteria bacterium RIFCSPLOWO2_02_FULL_41_13b]|uniref:Uncharacterized protein n=1 Tax=Candidatus Harrisonbacteria bacterium RIFCSPLOWO2_02_FULL_41_13b TaxID=1798409 RepID=A0A1G1ZQU4_9BACT|nr:MAG: hypothetical protein A3J53_00155 [Candidatus Harrisonbacteria bacterium RIFCSPHIGHO2_02_FULL_40_20]OGY66815.1 MAG: hypothetical protein A3I24_03945 [Candidatus Harrisonbacteria bacterium RIFCSPLOWO2_02_FULL_41_13b]